MQKLIIAALAILVTGVIGAFSVPGNNAQDARRETRRTQADKPRVVEVEEGEIIEGEDGDWFIQRRRVQTPDTPRQPQAPQPPMGGNMPMMRMTQPQAGTWQVVSHDDILLLLNTASGETFMLDDNDDGLFWRPIPRPGMGQRDMPRGMPEMPRMPGMDRPNGERPNREQLEQKLEQLHKRLKESEGERREQVKKAIEELENSLEKLGNRDRGNERNEGADRERRRDELQGAIEELERKIGALKEKANDTDSKKEARKIEEQIGELKDKANALRKELKGLGR